MCQLGGIAAFAGLYHAILTRDEQTDLIDQGSRHSARPALKCSAELDQGSHECIVIAPSHRFFYPCSDGTVVQTAPPAVRLQFELLRTRGAN